MKNLCTNDFLFDLYQQLSQSIHHNEDSTANSQFETFVDIIQTLVNNHASLCNACRNHRRMWQKPWLTPCIYKSILTKNKMYHKLYNKKNTPLYNNYKVYRNNLSRIIKVAKQQYYYTLISSNKNDTKKFHQILRDLINLTLWHPAAFGDFQEEKRLNTHGFAQEFLRSCSGYGPSQSVKRRGKSSSMHSKKKFLLGGGGFFVSDVISGGLLGHLGPLCLPLGANR